MSDFNLTAEVRSTKGKGASRRQRRIQQTIPAIIYGAGKDPQMLSLQDNKVRKAMENEAFFSQVLELDIAGSKQQAVLRDIQLHPANSTVLHMDFLRVTGKETINMRVPLHFTKESISPGVKAGGLVSHIITDVEIKALPKDIPEFIEVDISTVELDASLYLSSIQFPSGVEFAGGEIDDEHDQAIVSITTPKRVEVEPEAEEAPQGSDAEGDKGSSDNDKA